MPTRGKTRGAWGEQAVQSFLRQSYPHRELIILDDADDPTFPLSVGKMDGIHYLRLQERLPIPAKRNWCCQMAKGTIVCHWDSDDWSAPERISEQVARLTASGKAVTGYHSMLFYDERSLHWTKYIGHTAYALGTSLCYLKSFWQAHPFRHDPSQSSDNIGEDNMLVGEARELEQLISVDAGLQMVARAHADNTSPKPVTNQTSYRTVSLGQTPAGFFL